MKKPKLDFDVWAYELFPFNFFLNSVFEYSRRICMFR